ncbi:nSTAND1 domain-containing NTPase [Sorangium sp. So ce1151]|uniref:nSTAND1 domain-containing NTPase n=1 Tax=Sorangium sp. So ce1151 TaxID=3133332 RepID=UPI003F643A57
MSEPVAPSPDDNPFPGPRPYRTADRHRFCGRKEAAQKLADRIFVHPALTLYGPSGAGKSSLMAAGVIPLLEKEHDMRVVRVDTWPTGEAPLLRLTTAIFKDLELGVMPEGKSGRGAIDEAMRLSRLQSDRPVLVYLDQIERIFCRGAARGRRPSSSMRSMGSRIGRVEGCTWCWPCGRTTRDGCGIGRAGGRRSWNMDSG